jgi:carboxymethylenebutenolidase
MNDYQRYLVDEFAEEYQEGRISRRKALRLILGVTGSMLLTDAILAACTPAGTPAGESSGVPTDGGLIPTTDGPAASTPSSTAGVPGTPTTASNPTSAAAATPAGTGDAMGRVSPDDAAISAGAVDFPGEGTTLKGYQAIPRGSGPYAIILVCHENRGLTPYIADVTRRLAKAGYAALAVDLLSRKGGTAALNADDVPGVLGNSPPEQFISDFRSGWNYLKGQAFAQGERVGMVGFCFGGGVTWRAAVAMPELLAAVPFYGPLPPVADVPKIKAAVLAIYAGNDTRITSGAAPIEAAMQASNKVFEKIVYPNVDHAFHNDTGTRYAPQAAQDAWAKTLDWFGKYVRG